MEISEEITLPQLYHITFLNPSDKKLEGRSTGENFRAYSPKGAINMFQEKYGEVAEFLAMHVVDEQRGGVKYYN